MAKPKASRCSWLFSDGKTCPDYTKSITNPYCERHDRIIEHKRRNLVLGALIEKHGQCEHRDMSGFQCWQPIDDHTSKRFCTQHERWQKIRLAKAKDKKERLRADYVKTFGEPEEPIEQQLVKLAGRILTWAAHQPGCMTEQHEDCDCGWQELYDQWQRIRS